MLFVEAARAHDASAYAFDLAFIRGDSAAMAAELATAGVGLVDLRIGRRSVLGWVGRLRGVLRDRHYGIVHLHSPVTGIVTRLVVLTLPRSRRPRLVSTLHSPRRSMRWFVAPLWFVTAPLDDHRLVVSENARSSQPRWLQRRSEVLTYGIATERFSEGVDDRRSVDTEFSLDEDVPVILTVANLLPPKNHDQLIRAAVELKGSGRAFRWLMVGDGELRVDLERRVVAEGLQDVVLFTGWRSDIPRFLRRADLFVLGSHYEGLPVSVMEALASGTPVAASAVGGLPEHFAASDAVELVAPDDAGQMAATIGALLDDVERRGAMASAARLEAGRFHIDATVARLESLYGELCALGAPQLAAPPTADIPERLDD